MKISKNMVARETEESKELFIALVNTALIYPQIKSVVNSLKKKADKGVYNSDLAVKAFYPVVNNMAKLYCEQYGSWSDKWYKMFNTQCRYTVACHCVGYFDEDIFGEGL